MNGYDPDDLRTHHRAWRRALEIARDSCRLPSGVDERTYWEHELKVFDRTMGAICGDPGGVPICEVKVVRQIAAAPSEHPEGPGNWWGEFNPWQHHAVHVPVDDLARALGHDRVPDYWLAYSSRLDGYLLRQPGGEILAGVRYGSCESEYLSPAAFSPEQQGALRALAERAEAELAAPRP